mmetsp:Transcript_3804/g.7296  ORF Transcript_3804/g.7296 Transcript_3804/m.7296 type:complete len:235 (+) Transcript_3804:1431-2135(+)
MRFLEKPPSSRLWNNSANKRKKKPGKWSRLTDTEILPWATPCLVRPPNSKHSKKSASNRKRKPEKWSRHIDMVISLQAMPCHAKLLSSKHWKSSASKRKERPRILLLHTVRSISLSVTKPLAMPPNSRPKSMRVSKKSSNHFKGSKQTKKKERRNLKLICSRIPLGKRKFPSRKPVFKTQTESTEKQLGKLLRCTKNCWLRWRALARLKAIPAIMATWQAFAIWKPFNPKKTLN